MLCRFTECSGGLRAAAPPLNTSGVFDSAIIGTPCLAVTQIPVNGYDDNFAYLIHDTASRHGFIVDPSGDASDDYRSHQRTTSIEVVGILLTHTHHDHIDALDRNPRAISGTYICRSWWSGGCYCYSGKGTRRRRRDCA